MIKAEKKRGHADVVEELERMSRARGKVELEALNAWGITFLTEWTVRKILQQREGTASQLATSLQSSESQCNSI